MFAQKLKASVLATTAAGALALAMSTGAGSANAAPLTDFTLDAGGIDGLDPSVVVMPINEITINGVFDYSIDFPLMGQTIPLPGQTFTVDGLAFATGFSKLPPASIPDFGLNDPSFVTIPAIPFVDLSLGGWETTFKFTVGGVFGLPSFDGGTGITTFPFVHLAGGTLEVYIDNLSPGDGAQADAGGTVGDFTTDAGGTLVGTFVSLAGNGGTIDVLGGAALSGNDTITFQATSLAAGVWKDAMGDDLATKCLPGLDGTLETAMGDPCEATDEFAFTAFVGTDLGPFDPTGITVFACPLTSAIESCGIEDGSANFFLQEVPEPSSLAAFGIGLLGLAGMARRRRQIAA